MCPNKVGEVLEIRVRGRPADIKIEGGGEQTLIKNCPSSVSIMDSENAYGVVDDYEVFDGLK